MKFIAPALATLCLALAGCHGQPHAGGTCCGTDGKCCKTTEAKTCTAGCTKPCCADKKRE